MEIINRIMNFKNKDNKTNTEKKVNLNGECITLVKKIVRDGKEEENIISEFDFKDLRNEYKSVNKRKSDIEILCSEWGVDING